MQHDREHGLPAHHPQQIPPRGWLVIVRCVVSEAFGDQVFIASSGIAFLALFALLPMLTALISVYGLVSSPQQLSDQLQSLSAVAPHGVINALGTVMRDIVRHSGLQLGFGVALSIAAAVWVAVRGVLGVISTLNIVYGIEEKRSWPALLGTAVALAFGALAFWLLALVLIIGAPLLIDQMSWDSTAVRTLVLIARWLVIAAAALVSMTVVPLRPESSTGALGVVERWVLRRHGAVAGRFGWHVAL